MLVPEDNINRFFCDYYRSMVIMILILYSLTRSLTTYDCEEILKRTTDTFKIVFHDYIPRERNRNTNKTII